MKPIAYVARLNEFYRSQGFPAYQWTVNETAPLTALKRPLNRCRVAMLTSGGVSRKDAPPFNPQARNDLRVDSIDQDTSPHFFAINDDYYNHSDAQRDISCIFPIERLRELEAEKAIGRLAEDHYGFGLMGSARKLLPAMREVARRIRESGADLALLVPA